MGAACFISKGRSVQYGASDTASEKRDLSTTLAMGGQALIEGVMMRGPTRVGMAVRRASGEIIKREFEYIPISKRIKWLGWPVIRGAVGLVESLKIGFGALNWSAEQAAEDDPEQAGKVNSASARIQMALSMFIATVLALGLFMYFPLWAGKSVATLADAELGARQVLINVVAGIIRIAVLIAYVWTVSRWKDIHRVFQYHGSEHKTIFAFESGKDLEAKSVIAYTRFHPRCGTSFLLIVALAAILFFMIVDSLVVIFIGDYPSVLERFIVHLALVPIVAGISYEILKYSAKNTGNRIVKVLIQPGLWLQRITTQEPDLAMCEVAVTALKSALAGTDNADKTQAADSRAA